MDSEYLNKVQSFLQNFTAGTEVIILNVCKLETMDLFVSTIKTIINKEWYVFGWEFTFSNDFKRLKRISVEDKEFLMSKKK